MGEVGSEVRILLLEHDWDSTIPLLIHYAKRRSERLYWRGKLNGRMPCGREMMDIVNQAVMKVLSGERQWNPRCEPDLFAFLLGVVSSEINHLAVGWENRNVTSIEQGRPPEHEDRNGSGLLMEQSLAQAPDRDDDPEKVLLRAEHERRSEETFWDFHAALRDDPLLQQYVWCIYNDVSKPGEIARRLNLPPEEIYNMRRRLENRLRAYLRQRDQSNRTPTLPDTVIRESSYG